MSAPLPPFGFQTPGVRECADLARELGDAMTRHNLRHGIFFGIGFVRPDDERIAFLRGHAAKEYDGKDQRDAFLRDIGHRDDCAMLSEPPAVCTCGWRERVGPDGTGAK